MEPVLEGARLGNVARNDAAHTVAEEVLAALRAGNTGAAGQQPPRVLITGDRSLVDSTGQYHAVRDGLVSLLAACRSVTAPGPGDSHATSHPNVAGVTGIAGEAALDAGAQLAAAIPAIVDLFRISHSLAATPLVTSSTAAQACTAGALLAVAKGTIIISHDGFRIASPGEVWVLVEELRAELVRLAGVRGPGAEATFAAGTDFLAEISSVAPGLQRSALATAGARDQLGSSDGSGFSHVLYLTEEEADAQQVTSRHPFRADTIAIAASVTLSYLLLETATNRLVAAGGASGRAHLQVAIDDLLA